MAYQNQNPVKNHAINWLKESGSVLMDRSNAPENIWFQAHEYLADLHAVTADKTLNWKTPQEMLHGETPDISPYLHFHFYEKVYYLDPTKTYPKTKERSGYWLGVAQHIGDFFTYKILTDDMEVIIFHSVVHLFCVGSFNGENPQVGFDPDLDPDPIHDSGEGSQRSLDINTQLRFDDTHIPLACNPELTRQSRINQKQLTKKQLQWGQQHPTSMQVHSSSKDEDIPPPAVEQGEVDAVEPENIVAIGDPVNEVLEEEVIAEEPLEPPKCTGGRSNCRRTT